MSVTSGQAQAGTAPSLLVSVPAGPCTVIVTNGGAASPVWASFAGTVTAGLGGNGFPLPSGVPVAIPVYRGSLGGVLNMVTSSGSASVGWVLSTATGQTGI